MAIVDHVTELVVPILEPLGCSLYDVEHLGGTLRVTIDRAGGVDLECIATVTRRLSKALDAEDPVPGRYTLEVSSPGLERRLRTAAHRAAAVGERVSLKLAPHVEGDRRVVGTLTASDDTTLTVRRDDGTEQVVDAAGVTRAVTVFEWEPTPKPGSPGSRPGAAGTRGDDPERRAAAR